MVGTSPLIRRTFFPTSPHTTCLSTLSRYAETQELLSKNDDLVREQQDTIRQLEEKLGLNEGEGYQGPSLAIFPWLSLPTSLLQAHIPL